MTKICNINKIKQIAIFIKEYSKIFPFLGTIVFILTIFIAFIWISGKDAEPYAFTLSLVSTLLFALPHAAEYCVPNRKPIRHMNFKEILDFITDTNAKDDWKVIATNWTQEAFLKEDPRLRLRIRFDDEGIHNENFIAHWANNHPDPNATSYWCNLTYDGALIDRYILVDVDGGRALLPLPNRNSLHVQNLPYKISEIFDNLGTLQEYMSRSGLSREKHN